MALYMDKNAQFTAEGNEMLTNFVKDSKDSNGKEGKAYIHLDTLKEKLQNLYGRNSTMAHVVMSYMHMAKAGGIGGFDVAKKYVVESDNANPSDDLVKHYVGTLDALSNAEKDAKDSDGKQSDKRKWKNKAIIDAIDGLSLPAAEMKQYANSTIIHQTEIQSKHYDTAAAVLRLLQLDPRRTLGNYAEGKNLYLQLNIEVAPGNEKNFQKVAQDLEKRIIEEILAKEKAREQGTLGSLEKAPSVPNTDLTGATAPNKNGRSK